MPVYAVPALSELVGTWSGTVSSAVAGVDCVTITLGSDSVMTREGTTSNYPPATGRWQITGSQYVASGSTGGVDVEWTAPAEKMRMSGTWSVSNGVTGTFVVTRQ